MNNFITIILPFKTLCNHKVFTLAFASSKAGVGGSVSKMENVMAIYKDSGLSVQILHICKKGDMFMLLNCHQTSPSNVCILHSTSIYNN